MSNLNKLKVAAFIVGIILTLLPILSVTLYATTGITWWANLSSSSPAEAIARFLLLAIFHVALVIAGLGLLIETAEDIIDIFIGDDNAL